MIEPVFYRIIVLGKSLGLSLIFITVTRLLLYFLNPAFFNLESGEVVLSLFYGLRFDLSALAAYQSPYILLFFIYFGHRFEHIRQRVLGILFHLSNFVLIGLNCMDSIYFRFILKRSTADVFKMISTGEDTLKLMPQFFADYWYMLVATAVLWLASVWSYRQIKMPGLPGHITVPFLYYSFVSLVLISGMGIIAIRGGFQLKPLRPINAVQAMGMQNASLLLNTPFTIMKTLTKKGVELKRYFPDSELRSMYTPVFRGSLEGPVIRGAEDRKRNVVLIIMESFSKEYMGAPNGSEGHTPFLDSLAGEGLFFNHAFANGKRSMEGIPAILAGVPALMEEPYISSVYSNNPLDAVGIRLKDEGYHTSFFHGGRRGTMGFDAFTKLAGFDQYYGMEDFDGPDSYDGSWGIYDEPFFQYFCRKLNNTKEPFFSSFFSISSHHPFKIPAGYEDVFSEGVHPILNTVSYADMALKKFFEEAKESAWYENTLFIVTADHTGPVVNHGSATQLSNFAIPLLFFSPGDASFPKGISEKVTQQTDIPVSILDYLAFQYPFFSFGNSCLDRSDESGFALNFLNNVYQFISGDYVLYFNGEESIGFYNYRTDSLLKNSLLENEDLRPVLEEKEKKCRAVIQTYQSTLHHGAQKASFYANIP